MHTSQTIILSTSHTGNKDSPPNAEVFVLVPRVSVGLFPNRPVPVPKDGALVVVVPNPAGLLPNRFCITKDTVVKS